MKKVLGIPLGLLLFVWSASAQVSFVTHIAAVSSNHSAVTTSTLDTSACTSHCLIVAFVAAYQGANPTVSDSLGNTWILQKDVPGYYINAAVYATFSPTVGSAQTFTVGGYNPSIAVEVFSGVASGPNQTNGADHLSPASTGSVTPTNANELVVTGGGAWLNPTYTPTVSAGFTLVDSLPQTQTGITGNGAGIESAYQIQTAATAENATWTCANDEYGGVQLTPLIVTFYSVETPGALSVATTSLPNGQTGTPYSFQLTTQGGVAPITWSQTAGTLPLD